MLHDEPEILEEIRAANQRFYDAFNELSIERMDDVWENSDRAMCVHPGWTPIIGWQPIRESWVRIFDNANLMQFSVRYLNVVVQGEFGLRDLRRGHHQRGAGARRQFLHLRHQLLRPQRGWLENDRPPRLSWRLTASTNFVFSS